MGNGLENPTVPPQRPFFASMAKAVEMLIAHGNQLGDVDLYRVASTYAATPEQLSAEWMRQVEEASLKPHNFEEFDK